MLNTKQATLNASRRKLHASTNSRSSTTRSPTPTHPEHPRGSLTWRMRGMKALVLSVQQSASAGASKDGFAEKSFARYRKKRAVEEFGRLSIGIAKVRWRACLYYSSDWHAKNRQQNDIETAMLLTSGRCKGGRPFRAKVSL